MENKKVFKRKKIINIDMFKYNLLIIIGEVNDLPRIFRSSLEKHITYKSKSSNKLNNGYSSLGNKLYKGRYYYNIFIRGDIELDDIYEALHHELGHQRFNLVNKLGIEDDETSAYITGYFAKCVKDIVKDLLIENY